jgi:glycolate oxidase
MSARTRGMVRRLGDIVGAAHVMADPGSLLAYSTDATPLHKGVPDAVCLPRSTEEVVAIVRIAIEENIPLVTRGSGTNLCAATVPQLGGIVLVTTRLNRLIEIDTANMIAVCQPGLPTATLARFAAEAGLLYPPDPGSQTTSTIGGNVATCAGGLRGLKYGVTRDYVLGCEVVLGTGELIRCGGKVVKDVAGFDLVRLLCGSEGTLGVITELTLSLVPAPETSSTGIAYFEALAGAGRAVSRLIADGVLPATLEFLDATCLRTVEDFARIGLRTDAGALLIFGQDGSQHTVSNDMRRMADACRSEGAIEVQLANSAAEAADILAARRAALPSLSRLAPLTILEDATVPRGRIAEMVERIEDIAKRHNLLIGTFGHAGDGNLHPTCVLDPGEPGALERAEQAFSEVFAAARELGGTITGEHGIGLAKLPYLEAQLGAAQMALLSRIKKAFDPSGILNPGKLAS